MAILKLQRGNKLDYTGMGIGLMNRVVPAGASMTTASKSNIPISDKRRFEEMVHTPDFKRTIMRGIIGSEAKNAVEAIPRVLDNVNPLWRYHLDKKIRDVGDVARNVNDIYNTSLYGASTNDLVTNGKNYGFMRKTAEFIRSKLK